MNIMAYYVLGCYFVLLKLKNIRQKITVHKYKLIL